MGAKYEPTRLQIRDCCKIIRESWTDAERRRRGAWLHKDDLQAALPHFTNDEIRFALSGGMAQQ